MDLICGLCLPLVATLCVGRLNDHFTPVCVRAHVCVRERTGASVCVFVLYLKFVLEICTRERVCVRVNMLWCVYKSELSVCV